MLYSFQMLNRSKLLIGLIGLALSLVVSLGYAEDDIASEEQVAVFDPDPWEGWNRGVYRFNKVVDAWTLKPLSQFYLWVTPSWGEAAIDRFFANLEEPQYMINHAMQGKWSGSLVSFSRFCLNTVLGFGGILDVASDVGLEADPEDFGQSLAAWGWKDSRYLVLPFWGPSTLRDSIGYVAVDRRLDPVNYLEDVRARNTLTLTDITVTRSSLLAIEALLQGDEYIFVRDTFLQTRSYSTSDGEVEDSFLDDDF